MNRSRRANKDARARIEVEVLSAEAFADLSNQERQARRLVESGNDWVEHCEVAKTNARLAASQIVSDAQQHRADCPGYDVRGYRETRLDLPGPFERAPYDRRKEWSS